jgi:hypothetical protein
VKLEWRRGSEGMESQALCAKADDVYNHIQSSIGAKQDATEVM